MGAVVVQRVVGRGVERLVWCAGRGGDGPREQSAGRYRHRAAVEPVYWPRDAVDGGGQLRVGQRVGDRRGPASEPAVALLLSRLGRLSIVVVLLAAGAGCS
jgi:hypothetical protein